jgi:hypothetical protein
MGKWECVSFGEGVGRPSPLRRARSKLLCASSLYRTQTPLVLGSRLPPPKPNKKAQTSWTVLFGGRGGIRTHGTLAGTTVFKTVSIDHSDTLPQQGLIILKAADFPKSSLKISLGLSENDGVDTFCAC